MRWRCLKCGRPPHWMEWEGDPQCPRCGRLLPHIFQLYDTHLIAIGYGPLNGVHGESRIVCEPDRPYLNRMPGDNYIATDDPRSVTCLKCKASKEWQELAALFPEIAIEEFTKKAQLQRLLTRT